MMIESTISREWYHYKAIIGEETFLKIGFSNILFPEISYPFSTIKHSVLGLVLSERVRSNKG